METIPSFAPLAARLAAHAAAVRSVDESRDDLAKIMSLVICALLEMLICVCAALDARSAAGSSPVAASADPCEGKSASVQAPRGGRPVLPRERSAYALSLVPVVRAVVQSQAAASSKPAKVTSAAPVLVWSRDPGPIRTVPAPPCRPRWETRLFHPRLRTALLLLYRN